MRKRPAKSDLPEKTCAACGRPFAWRRKWARDWDNVKTCSKRCKRDPRRKGSAVQETTKVLAGNALVYYLFFASCHELVEKL